MAKSDQKKAKGVELEPDAWSRFERAIDVVAKSPPQHRAAQFSQKKIKKPAAKKKRP
jgi:hypothetical protein